MSVIVTDSGFAADDLGPFALFEDIQPDTQRLAIGNDIDPLVVAKRFGALEAISIEFPSFADGRGFSLARQIRQLGFTGRLRAIGHLISDQYYHARRAGFDEIEISDEMAKRQPEDNWKAEGDWNSDTYQDRLNVE